MEDHVSKKELKELRKLRELEFKTAEKRQNTIKWVAISVVSVLFLIFFVSIIAIAKQSKSNTTVSLSSSGWVRGDEKAKVTIAEFGDLQCPACKTYEPMLAKLLQEYKGKINLHFKHFPLESIHKNALLAAQGAQAAGNQGKFFDMHDKMYDQQESWSELEASEAEKIFIGYAKDMGLNLEKFEKDMKDKKTIDEIKSQQNEGVTIGVSATPTFLIRNVSGGGFKMIQSPNTYEEFKKVIDESLKSAK